MAMYCIIFSKITFQKATTVKYILTKALKLKPHKTLELNMGIKFSHSKPSSPHHNCLTTFSPFIREPVVLPTGKHVLRL